MKTNQGYRHGVWYVQNPIWGTDGFVEPEAQELWERLPEEFQVIGRAEILAGNTPRTLQFDFSTQVPLLSFSGRPVTEGAVDFEVHVHRRYEPGNYCYDGTLCTYELKRQRAFLAFDDPDYVFDDAAPHE